MTVIFFYIFLSMSLCPGHDSNVARGGDKANMYSLPTGIHENLVARPLNSPAKRDEKTWEIWDVLVLR